MYILQGAKERERECVKEEKHSLLASSNQSGFIPNLTHITRIVTEQSGQRSHFFFLTLLHAMYLFLIAFFYFSISLLCSYIACCTETSN